MREHRIDLPLSYWRTPSVVKRERGPERGVRREAGKFRKQIDEFAFLGRNCVAAAFQPKAEGGNRFVGADESDFQLRRGLRVAEVKRAEARDAETDIDMCAAVGELKI